MSGRRRAVNPDKLEFFELPCGEGDSIRIYGTLNQIRKYLNFTPKMIKELQRRHWIDIHNSRVDISFGFGKGSWHDRKRFPPLPRPVQGPILTAK